MREFFAQDITALRDDRQLVDTVAQGRYTIGMGLLASLVYEMSQKGLPLASVPGERLKEGTKLSGGTGGCVLVVDKPPHPNALKVYLDYLLSQEGQLEVSKATGLPSRRVDVAQDHVPPYLLTKPGGKYLKT